MTKTLKLMAVFLSALLLVPGALIAANYKEKIHYQRVVPPQPTTTGNKVEVVEMFWYGCPHFNNLEPYVERWLRRKPKNAEFVRIPAIFRSNWEPHARAFYTAEILGVLEKTHSAMFEALHNQKRKLDTDAQIMKFFAEHGVKEADFKRVFRSFAVEAKIRRAKDLSRRYGIEGVPSLIVNGKFRTGARLADSNGNIFKVVNHLVAQEAK